MVVHSRYNAHSRYNVYFRYVAVAGCLTLGSFDLAYINLGLGPVLYRPSSSFGADMLARSTAASVGSLSHRTLSQSTPAPLPPRDEAASAPGAATGDSIRRAEPRARAVRAEEPVRADFPPTVTLRFGLGAHDLDSSAERYVNEFAVAILRSAPAVIEIDGHADDRGPSEYNAILSARRAAAVAEALRKRGVPPEQIRTRAFGEKRPARPGRSAEALASNRRVEIRIAEYKR